MFSFECDQMQNKLVQVIITDYLGRSPEGEEIIRIDLRDSQGLGKILSYERLDLGYIGEIRPSEENRYKIGLEFIPKESFVKNQLNKFKWKIARMKELINEIVFNKISLGEALTRTKVIAYSLKNEVFKAWIKKELEGYDFDDGLLPPVRKIRIVNYLTLANTRQRYSNPLNISDSKSQLYDVLQFHRVLEPISIIEMSLTNNNGNVINILFTPEQASMLYSLSEKRSGEVLVGGYMEASRSQYQNIVEQTKQKLIDTLLELDEQFPNLEEKFISNKDNNEKVSNIITTTIYGGNNPLSIAAGQNVVQKDIVNTISVEQYNELENLGVEKHEIDELKEIVQSKTDNKPVAKQILKWIGSVSTAMTARGLYDKIPALIEFVNRYLHFHF